MIKIFKEKIRNIEETGSMGNFFIPLGNLKIKLNFFNRKSFTRFFNLSAFTFLLANAFELNLKKEQKKYKRPKLV